MIAVKFNKATVPFLLTLPESLAYICIFHFPRNFHIQSFPEFCVTGHPSQTNGDYNVKKARKTRQKRVIESCREMVDCPSAQSHRQLHQQLFHHYLHYAMMSFHCTAQDVSPRRHLLRCTRNPDCCWNPHAWISPGPDLPPLQQCALQQQLGKWPYPWQPHLRKQERRLVRAAEHSADW